MRVGCGADWRRRWGMGTWLDLEGMSWGEWGDFPYFKSQISNCRFQISSLKFQIADFKSQVSNFKWQISNLKSQIFSFQPPDAAGVSRFADSLWTGPESLGIR